MKEICITVLLCFTTCVCNKYSAVANDNVQVPDFATEERPFRMQKINLLWEKAKKRLSGTKLADLYVDLRVQDKHETALKKIIADKMDKDGLQEAQAKQAFREIIEKYGFEDYFGGVDNFMTNDIPLHREKKWTMFTDKKLQSMWARAEKAEFTAKELDKLREEFWHQQMKIDEMILMKNQLNLDDDSENDIDSAIHKNEDLAYDLKMKHKDVKSGYHKLENMFSEAEKEKSDFKDHRIYHLWAMAQKTNWSEEELTSFKEELKHFENRLLKHDFYTEQLLRSENALKDEVADGQHPEKHQLLQQKTSDLGQKVKKLHAELKTKVNKAFLRHVEL